MRVCTKPPPTSASDAVHYWTRHKPDRVVQQVSDDPRRNVAVRADLFFDPPSTGRLGWAVLTPPGVRGQVMTSPSHGANTKALPGLETWGRFCAVAECGGAVGSLARSRPRPRNGVLDRSTSSVQQSDASLSSRSPDRRKRPSEFLLFDGSPLRGSLVGSLSRIGYCPNRTNTASRASPVHNPTWGSGGMFPPNGYMHEPPAPPAQAGAGSYFGV
jgi:hypothetical protein